jgi:hypothetical protein
MSRPGSVAFANLVGWLDEILPASAVSQTEVRTHRDHGPVSDGTADFSLSLHDLEELVAERGLKVDHTTIWRWTQTYGPEVYRRLRGEVKRKSSTIQRPFENSRPRARWRGAATSEHAVLQITGLILTIGT